MQPVACRLLDCFLFSIPSPSLLQSLALSLSLLQSLALSLSAVSCTLALSHARYTHATLTLHSRYTHATLASRAALLWHGYCSLAAAHDLTNYEKRRRRRRAARGSRRVKRGTT